MVVHRSTVDPYRPGGAAGQYECRGCGRRMYSEGRVEECPDCGDRPRNIAVARDR